MPAPRRLLAACSAAALPAAIAIPAPASAATIASTVPCVASLGVGVAPTLRLTGTGFTPNAAVAIRTSSPSSPTPRILTTVTTRPDGTFATATDPPPFNSGATLDQSFNLLAGDTKNPTNTASSTYRQVRFGFDAKPSTGRPDRTVTYTARGFPPPGGAVYAHFRFGGRTRRTVRLGIPRGPCGIVSRRMALLPTTTRFGTWTIFMDQSPVFRKSSLLQAQGSLTIRRTLPQPGSRATGRG